MQLGNSYTDWAARIDYLGVRICAGRSLIFDVSSVKQSFFMAYNCIHQAAQYNDQRVHLALQEAYCTPILTYGIAAMTLDVEQMRMLTLPLE
jgi:hypothetical protein